MKTDWPCRYIWLPVWAFLGFIGTSLWFSFSTHITQAENKALTVVRAVEQHASATIERANLGLRSVVAQIELPALNRYRLSPVQQRQLDEMLEREQQALSGVISLALIDAQGVVIANTVGWPAGTDPSQRAYFRQLMQSPPGSIAITEVAQDKISKKWGLHIARRIDLPDGHFGGAIVARLDLHENFESYYETLGLGPQGLITLRDQDNTVLVRFPVVDSMVGKTILGSTGSKSITEQVSEKVLRSISPVDQVDRITIVRKLPQYPIYAIVGISYEEVLNHWLKHATPLMVMGAVIVVLAAFTSMMAQNRFALLWKLEALSIHLKATNLALVEANARIEHQSLHDQLTGAWNRRFADLRLQEAIAKSTREDLAFSVVMFDLDNFKAVNDCWGHLVGDSVLVEFVRLIQARLRITDILARWGGEEFLLLLEGSEVGAAAILAEQLRTVVAANTFAPVGALTVSIGVAQFQPSESQQELIHRVDTALYAAKHAGRNQTRQSDFIQSCQLGTRVEECC